ncbi:uncharacterized protein LOC132205011 [Neocloeon triangulifer]|uniref:uncharacterized protein LOC132205011 n=1 Tax=Neocloeon triangulifer TaxID=2078957 RepID=UPI00286EF5B2|nr:uncharacterized protein LOC132205011 [Neocloeon triangulifer]
MKCFSLVVFALVLLAVFAEGAERDCSPKCQCTNVPNKTEFCGIQGIKRVTFSSSCEMLCHNCQNKTNFKYQSPGKCPADATTTPPPRTAQAGQAANVAPKPAKPAVDPAQTVRHLSG